MNVDVYTCRNVDVIDQLLDYTSNFADSILRKAITAGPAVHTSEIEIAASKAVVH